MALSQQRHRTDYCLEDSAVVGSMTARTSEIRFAGKPPCCACMRTISSLGADGLELFRRHFPGIRNLSFDHIFGHDDSCLSFADA
jgi:hypothetical protein